MTVELKPETERLVQEELHRGSFHSLDELIVQGVQAWREKNQAMTVIALLLSLAGKESGDAGHLQTAQANLRSFDAAAFCGFERNHRASKRVPPSC